MEIAIDFYLFVGRYKLNSSELFIMKIIPFYESLICGNSVFIYLIDFFLWELGIYLILETNKGMVCYILD